MDFFRQSVFLLLLSTACTCFQWSSSSQDGAQLQICSGDPVKLPWFFNLSSGEHVQDMEWRHKALDGKERVVASYEKNFVPTADFSGRVSYEGSGAIELSCATILESGTYTVVVRVIGVTRAVTVHRRSAIMVINDTPKTLSGGLEIQQERKAVRDVTTNLWHVELTCGQFSDRGHPPVDVIWEDPDGKQFNSASFQDGYFHLPLPNPTKGGKYSCSLPSFAPATKCLAEQSALRNAVMVDVDEIGARFSLLEAQQSAMQLQLDNDMASITTGLDDTASGIRVMDERMTEVSSRFWSAVEEVQNTTQVLQSRLDAATRRVYFHAVLGSKLTLTTGSLLQPFSMVINNDGQAFDATTGTFTAPVNGVFFFVGSTGPQSGGTFGNMALVKDGVALSQTYIQQYGTYDVMGTCHAIVHLNKGQKVWLECYSQNSVFWDGTAFTGFLIHADN